jgi:hypothetical protein
MVSLASDSDLQQSLHYNHVHIIETGETPKLLSLKTLKYNNIKMHQRQAIKVYCGSVMVNKQTKEVKLCLKCKSHGSVVIH